MHLVLVQEAHPHLKVSAGVRPSCHGDDKGQEGLKDGKEANQDSQAATISKVGKERNKEKVQKDLNCSRALVLEHVRACIRNLPLAKSCTRPKPFP